MSHHKVFTNITLQTTLALTTLGILAAGCQTVQNAPVASPGKPGIAGADKQEVNETPTSDSDTKARRSKLLDNLTDLNSSLKAKEDSGLLPSIDGTEISAKQTIESLVKKHNQSMDLRQLRTYERVTAADLAPLEGEDAIEHIRSLNLARLELTDEALMPIRSLKLTELDLTMNRCSGLDCVSDMKSLEKLSVPLMPLTPKAFQRIGRLKALTFLDLGETGLTDDSLHHLEQLKKLKTLYIQGNHLSYEPVLRLKKQLPHCHFSCGFAKREDSKNIVRFDTEMKNGEYTQTIRALEAQMKRWHEKKPPDKDSLEKAYGMLGWCLANVDRKAEAETAFKKGLEITFACDTEHLALWAGPPAMYLKYLKLEKKWDESIRFRRLLEQKALSQRGTVSSLHSSWANARAENFQSMGFDLSQEKKFDRAADAYTKAATLYRQEPLLELVVTCKISASDSFKEGGNKIPAINSLKEAQSLIPELKRTNEKFANEKENEIENKLKQL
ncbi:MAG TPA: hypothetical protein V6C97_36630 [Oculatellaceae cyanobacterium]